MKYLLLCFAVYISIALKAQNNISRSVPFDNGWRFMRGDDAGASQKNYNDAAWRIVDLPHDWSIEDLPGQNEDSIRGPFLRSAVGGQFTAFTVGGTGWYRKTFTLPANTVTKSITINFDGVYMFSDVWINGHHLGNHPYGYTPFNYNITQWLNTGENVIAVRVANLGQNSRWYSGSGIYRHVWLTSTTPVHIVPCGLYITTPSASVTGASLQIQATVQNNLQKAGNVIVITNVFSPSGKKVASTKSSLSISAGSNAVATQQLNINAPQLWSTEVPNLYTTQVIINDGINNIDSVSVKTGIRSIAFTANGFMLNGNRVILKGGCVHQDNGPLGAAAFNMAEERKLQILKANGYNAIRTSHNPPSQSFLDICDSLGLLVMDEFFDEWEEPKLFKDSLAYHHFFKEWWKKDVDAVMLRDRNHPSIILWSIGNEIHERADTNGVRIAKQLVDEVHALDPTRPATEAVCYFWDHEGRPWDSTAIAFAPLDVAGYNYEWFEYANDHNKYPNRIMAGTESYPGEMLENFTLNEKLPYVIGDFTWTAMDYMGETGIGHSRLQPVSEQNDNTMLNPWPWYNAWCGDIDITGFKKPQSYYRDVVWRRSNIEMLVHAPVPAGMKEKVSGWGWPDEQHSWTWPGQEGKMMKVRVFTRSRSVWLELNGKIIEGKKLTKDSIAAVFNVPYEPGTLKAVAVEDGKEVGTVTISTTGTAKQLKLYAYYKTMPASRNGINYITVELTDAAKQLVTTNDVAVNFSINGPAEIIGVGNANPADMSSFQQPVKNTFKGRCIVVIRSTGKVGKISVTAKTVGLPAANFSIGAN